MRGVGGICGYLALAWRSVIYPPGRLGELLFKVQQGSAERKSYCHERNGAVLRTPEASLTIGV